MRAYQQGDPEALRRLMLSVVYDLENAALKYFNNKFDAWDAVTDAFARLLENHAQFQGDADRFRAWAWKTADFAAKNLRRAKALREKVEVADGEEHEPAPMTTATEVPFFEDPEAHAFVQQHLGQLKLAHRRVVELWLQKKTDAEIAAILTVEEYDPEKPQVVTSKAVWKRRSMAFAQIERAVRVRFPDTGAAGPMDLEMLVNMIHRHLMEDPVADELARLRQKVLELTEARSIETWRVATTERRWKADVARLEKERDAALARVGSEEEGPEE